MGSEHRLLLAVALAGASGASTFALSALANYVGNRTYRGSWTAYFLLRPFVGAGFAIVVYFYARVFLIEPGVGSWNYYGILATSFLAGIFSGPSVVKLAAIMDVLFAPQDARKDKIAPDGLPIGQRPLDRFSGFMAYRQVRSEGAALLTVWIQSNRPDDVPHTRIDCGEGPPAEQTRFRVSIYPNQGSAEPADGELRVTRQNSRSSDLQFRLVYPPQDLPAGLLEVSQYGRTVAVTSFGAKEPQ